MVRRGPGARAGAAQPSPPTVRRPVGRPGLDGAPSAHRRASRSGEQPHREGRRGRVEPVGGENPGAAGGRPDPLLGVVEVDPDAVAGDEVGGVAGLAELLAGPGAARSGRRSARPRTGSRARRRPRWPSARRGGCRSPAGTGTGSEAPPPWPRSGRPRPPGRCRRRPRRARGRTTRRSGTRPARPSAAPAAATGRASPLRRDLDLQAQPALPPTTGRRPPPPGRSRRAPPGPHLQAAARQRDPVHPMPQPVQPDPPPHRRQRLPMVPLVVVGRRPPQVQHRPVDLDLPDPHQPR